MRVQKLASRIAIIGALLAVIGCASSYSGQNAASGDQWAAHGYLSPSPTTEPELIGIYYSVKACRAAADEWASTQVVGNPVYAECYPVDKH